VAHLANRSAPLIANFQKGHSEPAPVFKISGELSPDFFTFLKPWLTNTKGKKRVGFAIKNRLKVMEILFYFILFYVLGERFLTVYVYWLQFFKEFLEIMWPIYLTKICSNLSRDARHPGSFRKNTD
jgi:hypothetical protein